MGSLNKYLVGKVLGVTGGVVAGGSPEEESRQTFIGNEEEIKRLKLREYDVWYRGDGDEILNLYNKENMIDFAYEPWYWKNKRNYFWSVSSTEDDVKRTHTGIARDIVNTLVGLVGVPVVESEEGKLEEILEDNDFWSMYEDEQLPLTLVEGWGCWKISWDLDIGVHPYISYYRAENVDFVWRSGKVIGVIFKDWYVGEKDQKYLVTEIRYLKPRIIEKDGVKRVTRDLYIETEVWKQISGGSDTQIMKIAEVDLPSGLKKVSEVTVINDYSGLLAQPCILFKNPLDDKMPGASIYINKIDLFDDYDMIASQQSNAVGKSTPEELFNTDFLERDPQTNLPIMPHRYDRKYTTITGGKTETGGMAMTQPVQVTQPNINFTQYGQAALDVISKIATGLISPSTMGFSVAVQSTAQSQREKEKVTIATRGKITGRLSIELKKLFSEVLCADEYLRKGAIIKKKYDVSIKFSEFVDASFEEKAQILSGMLDNGNITPEMYMSKLYGDSLSEEEYQRELDYLKKLHSPEQQAPLGDSQEDEGSNPMAQMLALAQQGGED